MAKSIIKTINSLSTLNESSVNVNSDLNTLRKTFDSNYETWKTLPAGDPQRQVLTNENEKLIELILNGR